MFIFENVESQYIDNNGKTRMLNFSDGVSLMTSPLPPFNVPTSDKKINKVDIDTALEFIEERKLKIMVQDGDINLGIKGLWVESKDREIYFGYIPIKQSRPLDDINFNSLALSNPLRLGKISDLKNMQHFRKVADFLRQYTLFEYSNNPENFNKDNFVVIPDYHYDIDSLEGKLIPGNKVMYKHKKIIVPSKEVYKRLIMFLKSELLNDTPGVKNFKDRSTIKDYFRTLSDFKKSNNQLTFLNRTNLIEWKK